MPSTFELSPDADAFLEENFEPVTRSKIQDHLDKLIANTALAEPAFAPYGPAGYDIYRFESDDGGDEFDLVAIFLSGQTGETLEIDAIVKNDGPMMV